MRTLDKGKYLIKLKRRDTMIQSFKGFTPQIDGTCYLAPGSMVIGNVEIEENVSIWHNAVIRGDVDKIKICRDSNVQDCCVLHCTKGIELVIGKGVTIGHGAILHSCEIGDNSLIGMGAIILDEVKIGNNCLIGAGALIPPRMVIPDGSLVIGSPAKIKRELDAEEIENMKKNVEEYIEIAREYER
jgi:carbonic anhydrase/acetyltransferase-like protein (isoleucine patch superfamily)